MNENKTSGLLRIEKISVLLDSKFTIPGTRFKYGLDPILGFLPIAGDLISFAISCSLLLYIARHGVSRKVMIMMAGNIIVDTVIGSIPILGNIFDFTFKANNRNIKLLKKYYIEGKHQGSGTGILLVIALSIVITIALIVFAIISISKFLLDLTLSLF